MKIYKKDSSYSRTVFDLAKKEKRKRELEKEVRKSDFWKDRERAIKISQELKELQEETGELDELKEDLDILKKLDEGRDFERGVKKFEKKLKEKELKVFLSGKYDKKWALLTIFAGAGGRDAQDWVTMLLRMYERYCQRKGYRATILHQSFGEGGGPEGRIGTKSVVLEIQGDFAFGFLKQETGVHRLVRISPFSSQELRHTSFALVQVIPEISKKDVPEIKIEPEDMKLETFRASGPGGQYVNRRESAVRITHLPTGIKVACQSERLQGLNRQKALKILIAKLYQFKKEKKEKALRKIKGERIAASWGNQIRSYVSHPYKLVKDLRTGIETSNVEEVLDGNLDAFIEAELKIKKPET